MLVANLIGSSLCLILPSHLTKRRIILFTNFVLVLGLLLTGPSLLLRLNDSDSILLFGLALTGLCIGISKTLSLIEAV